MNIDFQRLRNLTTGILHTEIGHVYEDIEELTGQRGIMTHMIPRAIRAMEPWLKPVAFDARFWDGKFDQSHTGSMFILPMTIEERAAMFGRFADMANPLAGKEVIVCEF